jgi:hypothetical protein
MLPVTKRSNSQTPELPTRVWLRVVPDRPTDELCCFTRTGVGFLAIGSAAIAAAQDELCAPSSSTTQGQCHQHDSTGTSAHRMGESAAPEGEP